ncbi:hypothetical protein NLG97_g10231 [Lecanicillium saksenae]|uniref:Uncharacterized protein n=1 Tax=Lecanicillium saksenae TaxID=468837 RepID=A0ACC1QE99_9HYPO|nr:hypothetical protein NLG97_g10231 [Lecanicillium saksenae]
MAKADETSIQNAIESVKSGVSVSKSAARWGVPRSTLRHRLRGTMTHAEAAESMQRLSKELEERLCGWIIVQQASGDAPTQKQVRDVATRLLVRQGDLQPLGKNWMVGFLRRNPQVKAAMRTESILPVEEVDTNVAEQWPNVLGLQLSRRRRVITNAESAYTLTTCGEMPQT